jgi:hypothetical protein
MVHNRKENTRRPVVALNKTVKEQLTSCLGSKSNWVLMARNLSSSCRLEAAHLLKRMVAEAAPLLDERPGYGLTTIYQQNHLNLAITNQNSNTTMQKIIIIIIIIISK